MTGKQLLDIAAIFKASRGVVLKHIALRRYQFDVYGKTSFVVKAFNKQFNKPTINSSSAFSTEPLKNKGHSAQAKNNESHEPSTTTPKQDVIDGGEKDVGVSLGHDQDYFYERPRTSTPAQVSPYNGLRIQQKDAERFPLPDGTVPPVGSDVDLSKVDRDTFSSVSQTEPRRDSLASKINEAVDTLEPASSYRPNILTPTVRKKLTTTEKVDGRRTSEERPSSTVPGSRSPRTAKTQAVTSSEATQQNVPEVQAIPEQGQPSEEMYSELFHSPRVARLLKTKPEQGRPLKSLDLQGVQDAPVEQSKASQEMDQDSFTVRPTAEYDVKITEGVLMDKNEEVSDHTKIEDVQKLVEDPVKDSPKASSFTSQIPAEVVGEPDKTPFKMHESRVPSSRFGRLWQYGGLATSMAFGAVGESFRRSTTGGGSSNGSLMLSAGNMDRIVAKLSKMRGAALKLGQMMSFQDSKALPAPINEILQRVQDSADYMPATQRNQVLTSNLGSDWQDLFSSFDEMPMAAASIGQVHGAVLKSSNQAVAVKVQYPGVADSIDSDLNNLALLLTASKLLPKGLYLDKTIANARTELAWECDYVREAESGKRFRDLLRDDQNVFVVPSIIDEASGSQVLTMERMQGIGVTKAPNLTQQQKDWIGTQVLRLCLREIIEFRFMQTDPNWTNFLFNARTQKLELLDFGASRDFPDRFIQPYIDVLRAASRHDRAACRDLSIQLGYLTGHESATMLKAHVDSILTLAEPFSERSPAVYDFRDQTITERVRGLIPVMLRERLAPPPEETYSLHRKLSGAFLLCARLGSRVRCREMFVTAIERTGLA